jgi:iron complex outermembrane receptor protein
MEKLPKTNRRIKIEFVRLASVASAGFSLLFVANTFAQNPSPPPGAPAAAAEATAERVIVTGSNIPTSEETGPNPVDTYRTEDIQKLGVVNQTDLLNKLPIEAGGTVNQNIANGGDGAVTPNLRGLLPKETLVLVDGKRVAQNANGLGVDINLIPFPMIDRIEILKDGASAIYGADAIAGVFNIILIHKFRGLEIGGTWGNTNAGASNDAREVEAWLKAGTGDDKTDILIIADAYDRSAIFSRDRNLTSNGNAIPFGGGDGRSSNKPGQVNTDDGNFFLNPNIAAPTPHSAANAQTDPQYLPLPGQNDLAPLPGGHNSPFYNTDFFAFNFAALTPAIPASDRQSFYGSFTRDLCDKYLTVFADFKYTRSFFNAAAAPTPFTPDPFHTALGTGFSPTGISVPIQNAFNPFTVADTTLPTGTPFGGVPVTTGVKYRSLEEGNRTSPTTKHDMLFDAGLKGEMGEFGDYFKTWNWELGFRYSRDEAINLSQGVVSAPGLREALLDTDPRTAFNPFLGFTGVQQQTAIARSRVYVTLHDTAIFETPSAYFNMNGDLFSLPAGPVSFAVGAEYRGERYEDTPDSLNTTFNTIGSTDLEASRVNRDVWGFYQEVRIPVTSPTWNFPGAYSLEFDLAEREEWYSQNTAATSVVKSGHSQFDTQRPKFSVRYQPIDQELTLRASYSEGFHAPSLFEISPASTQSFPAVTDPHNPRPLGGGVLPLTPPNNPTDVQVEERQIGNPNLQPEVAYEWSYGAVYSPKWLKGLTMSADWWHIDMRSIAALLGSQFILDHESSFPGLVTRAPAPAGFVGPVTLIIDPNSNLGGAVLEGLDYELIYILDTSIFGHGDWGQFTYTVNGTWVSRFELQVNPDQKPFGINGQFVPTGFALTSSLPRNRAFVSLFYHGPHDSWMNGLDVGATVHWTSQYDDDIIEGFDRKVREWTTLDLLASYTFNMPTPVVQEVPGYSKDGGKNVKMKDGKDKNVMPVSTATYSECGWRAWLNGTTVTLGMQNVFDADPPFVAGAFENNYDESLADVRGRFWYVGLKKRF